MNPDTSDQPGQPDRQDKPGKPVFRKLRAFVLDPSQSADLDDGDANEMVLAIPWEELACGPSGEYVTVVNRDHTGRELGTALNLDDPLILARGSLAPSDGNFLFHQQMVYAVAMRTIRLFEKALGRRVQWQPPGGRYTGQLKLYPRYKPGTNAQFQPGVGVTFGYIAGGPGSPIDGVDVFTCLSQDVIAHLVCHAIVCPHFAYEAEADNPDKLAFHEGFCDLVAVLQRCTQPEFVRRQLRLTRGDLTGASQLGIMAAQVGEAMGQASGLRSAFGEFDTAGAWRPRTPDRTNYAEYRKNGEAHHLGSLLFAAVFHCLDGIYRTRVADLLRIATDGTGILPPGDLHPDLVNRLTNELVISASHVLNMCIRALDYLPAVGITFGDYLRAILTADYDLVPDDSFNYRLAFAAGFRRFGIYPAGVGTLSVDTLLWPRVPAGSPAASLMQPFIRDVCNQYTAWSLPRDRKAQYALVTEWCAQLQRYFETGKLDAGLLPGIQPGKPFTVKSIWLSERAVPPGPTRSGWVIEIEQRVGGNVTSLKLLVDADTELLQHAIHKTVRLRGGTRKGRPLQPVSTLPLAPPPAPFPEVPRVRPLRVFTFDPSLELQLDTARISQVTLAVPWEHLSTGPIGQYLEVIDYDPASGTCYAPVNLNNPYLLAQAGYAPTQALPQFHQQMVYAVAMRTIRNFEHALGRLALWAPHRRETTLPNGKVKYDDEYVPQLRIYPHALREANAFYSPQKKSVLFGYFQSTVESATNPVTIFTCLSHDIIAHEMTHALLDGMHGRFAEPSNADAPAFHEAFADIVALFQHFSLPEALAHQIANTRGDLASQNRLGELAQEFGSAIGSRGALRSAIGQIDDKTGEWRPRQPDPRAYLTVMEPHARGALLVAAVFDAFLTIYRDRVADLLRIATRGTGVLPSGQLHPDLVQRLARRSSRKRAGCAGDVHSCTRLLPARRPDLWRLPTRHRDGRPGIQPGRRAEPPHCLCRGFPPARHPAGRGAHLCLGRTLLAA